MPPRIIPLDSLIPEVSNQRGCLIWLGRLDNYGRARFGHRNLIAARVVWEMGRGPIPEGIDVLHECDEPACVNILHLFLGTHQENMQDASRKGRIARGERVSTCKLNPFKVRVIRYLVLKCGWSKRSVGIRFGVSQPQIRKIVERRDWAWVK